MIKEENTGDDVTLFKRRYNYFIDVEKDISKDKTKRRMLKRIRFPEHKILPVLFHSDQYLKRLRSTHVIYNEQDEEGNVIEDRFVGFLKNKDFRRK